MQRHICQFFLSVPHGTDLHIPLINLQLNALGLNILFHRLIQRRIRQLLVVGLQEFLRLFHQQVLQMHRIFSVDSFVHDLLIKQVQEQQCRNRYDQNADQRGDQQHK